MKTEFEETVKVKRFKVTCDFCGKQQIDSWNGFDLCCICKKLTCYKCGEFFYEGGGDRHDRAACREHKERVRKAYNEYNSFVDNYDLDFFISKVEASDES